MINKKLCIYIIKPRLREMAGLPDLLSKIFFLYVFIIISIIIRVARALPACLKISSSYNKKVYYMLCMIKPPTVIIDKPKFKSVPMYPNAALRRFSGLPLPYSLQ